MRDGVTARPLVVPSEAVVEILSDSNVAARRITPDRPGTLWLEVELKSPAATLNAVAPLIVP
jgi:hypothetical protein